MCLLCWRVVAWFLRSCLRGPAPLLLHAALAAQMLVVHTLLLVLLLQCGCLPCDPRVLSMLGAAVLCRPRCYHMYLRRTLCSCLLFASLLALLDLRQQCGLVLLLLLAPMMVAALAARMSTSAARLTSVPAQQGGWYVQAVQLAAVQCGGGRAMHC